MAASGSRNLVYCCSDVQVRCRRVGGCSLHRDVVERHVLGRYGPPVMWVGVWLLRLIAATKAWWKLGLSMTATTWSTPPQGHCRMSAHAFHLFIRSLFTLSVIFSPKRRTIWHKILAPSGGLLLTITPQNACF